MVKTKGCLLAALLLSAACAPNPQAPVALVAVERDGVTVRYTRGGAPDPVVVAGQLAAAQCAKFARRARFEWDVELIGQDPGWPPSRATENYRLRGSGTHHRRFACESE